MNEKWDLEGKLSEIAVDEVLDKLRYGVRAARAAEGEWTLVDDATFDALAGDDPFRIFIERKDGSGDIYEVEAGIDLTLIRREDVPHGEDEHPAVEGVPDVQAPQVREPGGL